MRARAWCVAIAAAAIVVSWGCGPGGGPAASCYVDEVEGAVVLDPDVCPAYVVREMLIVGTGDTLTVEPGAVVRFQQDTGIEVRQQGVLSAVGTAVDPILLTGAQAVVGYWKGVRFGDAGSFDNELAYVTIEYGGSDEFSDMGAANLTLSGSFPTRAKVTHSTFRYSAGFGFVFDDEALIGADLVPDGDFVDNLATLNALGPGKVDQRVVGFLDDSGSYAGNAVDYLAVRGDYDNDVSQTWQALDVPYLVDGGIYVDGIELTIAAGATVVFRQDSGIEVSTDGAFRAIGAADAPIVFTGYDEIPGYWDGLSFHNAASFDNRLEHVVVEYGGGRLFPWGGRANVVVDESGFDSRVALAHATTRHSGGWGVWVSNGSSVTLSDITYASNTLGDFYQEP